MIGPRRSTLESDVMRGGEAVTFKEVLTQVIDWLQQDKRVSYRALKRQFSLDDAYLEDLKIELIEAQQLAHDENDRILNSRCPRLIPLRWKPALTRPST